MTANRVGIDFSQAYFDLLIADSNGKPITPVQRFSHDLPGSQQARDFICKTCQAHPSEELWIGGEATGLLWWHPFQRWAVDPQLAPFHPRFFLLNPAPVKAFRKTAPLRDKTDPKDARLITRYLGVPDLEMHAWYPDQAQWILRFATRARFRLSHHLSRLKTQALTLLYIHASAYDQLSPFADTFGATSQMLLRDYPDLTGWLRLSLDELSQRLQTVERAHLPDPQANARKLHTVARQSYPLDPQLQPVIHFLLTHTLDQINAAQKQLDRLDRFIASLVKDDPEVQNLQSIGGIGPVFAAGIAAELRPVERFFQGDHFDPKTGTFSQLSLLEAQAAVGKLAGLWWPRSDSGQFSAEDRHLPRACNRYLRYYLTEAANHVRGQVVEFQRFYEAKFAQATKHAHLRALVLTARKLTRLIFALLAKHQSFQLRRPARP